MSLKMPTIFTLTSITFYSIVFFIIAFHSNSENFASLLVFLITMPFLGMVAFALSATFCAVFCKKHKKEINKCHEAIGESVKKIIDARRVKSGTIEPDMNYQIVYAYKKEGL